MTAVPRNSRGHWLWWMTKLSSAMSSWNYCFAAPLHRFNKLFCVKHVHAPWTVSHLAEVSDVFASASKCQLEHRWFLLFPGVAHHHFLKSGARALRFGRDHLFSWDRMNMNEYVLCKCMQYLLGMQHNAWNHWNSFTRSLFLCPKYSTVWHHTLR